MSEITNHLFELRDEQHALFNSKLIPNIAAQTILGIKTPILRKFAAEIYGTDNARTFLTELPHRYFEENCLHAFVIEKISDINDCINAVEAFLPYIDNWATCDSLKPKAFKKRPDIIREKATEWICSEHIYTVRFGIRVFMDNFLDKNYYCEQPVMISDIHFDDYYVKMMVAWYFATALAKRYDDIIPFIESRALDRWTHNKAIQKAVESYRISPEQKEYLKTLKIR